MRCAAVRLCGVRLRKPVNGVLLSTQHTSYLTPHAAHRTPHTASRDLLIEINFLEICQFQGFFTVDFFTTFIAVCITHPA